MRKPLTIKTRCYTASFTELNEYLAMFTGLDDSNKFVRQIFVSGINRLLYRDFI